MTDRKFPIGPVVLQEDYTKEEIDEFIRIIASIPAEYAKLVAGLSDDDLLKTYREGSWNIRQLVHHVADLQNVHYLRLKKAITEPDYKEATMVDVNAWAGMPDSLNSPVAASLAMLDGAHARLAYLAGTLSEEQLSIRIYHPLRKFWFTQKQALAIAVWHVRHHLAHINLALGNIS